MLLTTQVRLEAVGRSGMGDPTCEPSKLQMAAPRLSVFPKCYFDLLCRGEMDYVQWIRAAAALGAEGIEHYDGFFRSFAAADVDPVTKAIAETGQVSSMVCFSPD